MNIGVDIRVLMDKHYSGVSCYTSDLLLAMFKEDRENNYSLFYNSWSDISERLNIWENERSKILKLAWPNKIFNYVLQKVFHYPKLDKFLGEPDIFWSPHFNFSSFSKSAKTKKIITVHDISFLRYPEFFSWRKNFWHKALEVKKILTEAEAIVAVSDNTKNDIVELLNIYEDKIRVIHSGFSLVLRSGEAVSKEDFFKKHGLNRFKDSKLILYLGTIEPRKNLVNLIRAYELWRSNLPEGEKPLPLVLAGSKGWKTSKIIAAWKKSAFKDDIFFLGYVSPEEKEVLYQEAMVFIYPSFYEGFGLPPLEAMARGIPVISSNNSSLPEVVSDAALTVNANNYLEITSAMTYLISDSSFREMMIERGRERVKLFSWEKTAKEYLDFFKEISER